MKQEDLRPFPEPESRQWLSLSEAAEMLGVHFTTLRRWADTGKTPHTRTPGGQRRFSKTTILQMIEQAQPTEPASGSTLVESNKQQFFRNQISRQARQSEWGKNLEEVQRMRFRYGGQMLLGLLMQYNSRSDSGDVFLKEAGKIAREHGENFKQMGMSISEAIKAFLVIRQPILNMIFSTSLFNVTEDADVQRLYQRTNDFLDHFLLVMVDVYSQETRSQ